MRGLETPHLRDSVVLRNEVFDCDAHIGKGRPGGGRPALVAGEVRDLGVGRVAVDVGGVEVLVESVEVSPVPILDALAYDGLGDRCSCARSFGRGPPFSALARCGARAAMLARARP